MNHSPGPWKVNEVRGTVEDAQGCEICAVHAADGIDRRYCRETCEANAILIGAAPELLEACKEALEWHNDDNRGDDCWPMIYDAIFKARYGG